MSHNPPLERTAAAVYFSWGSGVARAPPRPLNGLTLLGGATVDAREFWIRLEYRVGLEIDGLRGDDYRGLWCDGFAPEVFQLVGGLPTITGRVWLAKSGYRGGQERWRFSLLLPESVQGEQEIDWAAILPPDDVTGWLSLDQSRRIMKIDPAAAYPDRHSAAQ